MKKKSQHTTLGLSRHGGEELELASGSGEWLWWQEEEGGTTLIWMSAFSPGWCYKPRLKGYRGQLLSDGAVGSPLLSRLVIRAGTKGGRLQHPFRATSTKGFSPGSKVEPGLKARTKVSLSPPVNQCRGRYRFSLVPPCMLTLTIVGCISVKTS
jgi:hypothetical protein